MLKLALTALVALVLAQPALAVPDRVSTIDRRIDRIWHMQRVMGVPLTPTARSYRTSPSPAYRRWVNRLWQKRSRTAFRAFRAVPHRAQWECIHRYEGSWSDTGAPFYGGLQMDYGFQRTYGAYLLRLKGTAEHWSPLEQMWVAEHAYPTRGFYPWPHTARACGLL
jgi:hypothetical protein